MRRTALPQMPTLCLAPGKGGIGHVFVEMTCAGRIPDVYALAIGWAPNRNPERRRKAMSKREDDTKRRKAFSEGLLPVKYAGTRMLPDSDRFGTHIIELDALVRIAIGEQTAWDAHATETLAGKCFSRGCAVANGDVNACQGWYPVAVVGFKGRTVAP